VKTLPRTSINTKRSGRIKRGNDFENLEISYFSVPPDSAPRHYKSGNTVGQDPGFSGYDFKIPAKLQKLDCSKLYINR
jgi:hypothetical protein